MDEMDAQHDGRGSASTLPAAGGQAYGEERMPREGTRPTTNERQRWFDKLTMTDQGKMQALTMRGSSCSNLWRGVSGIPASDKVLPRINIVRDLADSTAPASKIHSV